MRPLRAQESDEGGASDSPPPAETSNRKNRALVATGGVVVVGGALVALRASGVDAQRVLDAVSSLDGEAGAAVFFAAYVVAAVALFPASVLTLGAGALYGPLRATALVSASATTGAVLSFLLSRYLLQDWVRDRLASTPRLAAAYRGVGAEGARLVLLLRLSPLVPFGLLNYALGATELPLGAYAAASWAGMLPGTFAYCYLGSAGRAAIDAATRGGAADAAAGGDAIKLALYVAGAAATVWATKLVAAAADKAIKEAEEAGGGGGEEEGDALVGRRDGGGGGSG